jgi:hypothetical protein
VYPIPIGTPGISIELGGGAVEKAGSPAYAVYFPTVGTLAGILISAEDVDAQIVVLWDEDDRSEAFAVTHQRDGAGRRIAIVDIGTPGSIDPGQSQYWVEYSAGGGVLNPYGSGYLERLGDVCAWALQRDGRDVDLPAWTDERSLLNIFRVGTYANNPEQTCWQFAQAFLQELPIEVRGGVDGFYPWVLRPDIAASECIAFIEEGSDFYPISAVDTPTEPADIVNEVVISYALRQKNGGYRRKITVTGYTDIAADIHGDARAYVSQTRYGVRSLALELDWVYDDATAARIGYAIIAARAFPTRHRVYRGHFTWGWLRVGDPIALTSDSLSFEDVGVEISSKRWVSGGWEFGVVWIDNPLRRSPS